MPSSRSGVKGEAGRVRRTRLNRNGHRTRKVSRGVGSLEIDHPKVRDTKTPFRSMVLDAWQRTRATLLSTLPSLYVEGLSTRDFERALSPLWKETVPRLRDARRSAGPTRSSNRHSTCGVDAICPERRCWISFSTVTTKAWRLGCPRKEAILVAHGVTRNGARTLLGVYLGGRESTESWKLAMEDLTCRGLLQPLLVVSDGSGGPVMDDAHLALVHDAVASLSKDPIVVTGFEELLAA